MSKSDHIWKLKSNFIHYINENMGNEEIDPCYYHYTSLDVLFSILEKDAFWISNVRFSNDLSEERLLQLDDDGTVQDDFIICFCDKDDQLSQWRGYCHGGGASIKFNVDWLLEYNILKSNYDDTREYIVYENVPQPVIYVSPDSRGADLTTVKEIISTKPDEYEEISNSDIIPYLKNNQFIEERESRMVFTNANGSLSECIRFRTLENKARVPYMVVKHGNVGKMSGSCATDPKVYADEKRLKGIADNRETIWIDEGCDQGKVYYEIMGYINQFLKKYPEYEKIPVFCKGHLPIEQIRVAPTPDRERIGEQVKRFCESKYWLHNVKVTYSNIPYIK